MTARDWRTAGLTIAVVATLLSAWGMYLIVRGPGVTSGGGTASYYAETSN